ncbi:hypothetical protein LJC37_03415, partial [Bacteroidales bacterium OttesenSCG-928-E04]|nr:hypothetical protein [Bacteroidales bacterium OttesenSCG-928-E04]
MKKTTLLLIFLFSIALSYSQSPQDASTETLCGLTNEDFFTKSDIVIRGDWLATQGKYETIINGKTDTMVVFGYRIAEIYKGDQSLRWQTIYVMVEKNKVFNYPKRYEIQGPDHRDEIPPILQEMGISSGYSYNMSSIFFLSKSDLVDDGCPEKFPPNKRYVFVCDEMSRLFMFNDKIVGLNDLVFQNRDELLDY